MTKFKGTIALDIDGTITVKRHVLETKVHKFLDRLIHEGWDLVFITGRTFSFAKPLIHSLEGPFAFAVQNGAALYTMPGEHLVSKHYLPIEVIPSLETILKSEGEGLLVESGRERKDLCYYIPEHFSREEGEYLKFRISISPERWKAVSSFESLPFEEFAVGKYFTTRSKAKEIANRIHALKECPFNVIVIRDPFRPGYYLAHVNAKEASKGKVLDEWLKRKRRKGPLIVAGDDYNDVEMLKRADVKIVMENAPTELHPLSDILAPPADEQGIIPALEQAIKQL